MFIALFPILTTSVLVASVMYYDLFVGLFTLALAVGFFWPTVSGTAEWIKDKREEREMRKARERA